MTEPLTDEEMCMQNGPCEMCGSVNYPLSFGGPTICPACDNGANNTPSLLKQIKALREENAKLKEEIENQKKYVADEVQGQIDEMSVDASDFDKDLWRELKPLLVKIGLDWNDYPDGIHADDALEFVRQYFQVLEEENEKLKSMIEHGVGFEDLRDDH